MMRKILGVMLAGAAYSGAALADDDGFELLSATLEGTPVMVFVDGRGTAVAVEVTDRGAQVLTGLAAGALLSDLREAEALPTFRASRASYTDAEAMIETLAGLSELQRSKLRTALALA
ncbi:hypothetical protein [Parvularcula dongshanensis]|uniref:Uncharacterized protein n=1 Tax=Parvularcula dongshanensis TaxID=1173995 RepID=A0A840I0I2_9PROT|nr:hypothetical protein [Parvularcula dongshanensis]MBB4657783.1 hypothetical protein [Parvularcula dongshanensis]